MKFPPSAPRILCLWLPEWPIQRGLAAQPERQRGVWLLTESSPRGELVRYCNPFARRRGVRSGMPVSEARTLVRGGERLWVEAVQAESDRRALVELALSCERYSFCIGLEEAEPPECVAMNVTGVASFFAGERALAEQLQAELAGRRLDGRIAIAETLGLAWAAAHFLARAGAPVVLDAERPAPLAALPIGGLRLSAAAHRRLSRLGIQTVGEVSALDRAALARRLGPEVLERLDQLLGRRPELITPCRPAARYRVRQMLEHPLAQPAAIESWAGLLLERLTAQLAPRRWGLRGLECGFHLEDRTTQALRLRLCQATSDLPHLRDLFRLHLERLRLHAAVIGLEFEAWEAGPLETAQPQFFERRGGAGERSLALLLDRLSSRLGAEAVTAAELGCDPIPERAVQWRAATDAAAHEEEADWGAARLAGWNRPTVLFAEPRALRTSDAASDAPPATLRWNQEQWEIVRHWGPERIESGWWCGEFVRRDYYWLETAAGEWLWVFVRLRDRRWFWQGTW